MQIKASQFAQAVLQLKGKPLDLEDYKPFQTIYDIVAPTLTAMCGRQIGKSVMLASSTITTSILRPYFSTLFVSPLSQQTSRFSSQYLEPFINSPIVRRHYVDSSSKKNIFLRTFNNSASITLGYAETEQDADRIRGIAADQLYYDEVQDVSLEALPILEETLSASPYKFKRFTGTAKGESNTLTVLFKKSNMMEWVVKCDHCGKHAIPNEFDICLKILTMNPAGPACPHCGELINMRAGVWMAGRPNVKDHFGFHIPQFSIPARTTPKEWPELVKKLRYDHVKLSNEVFGLAVGAGGRPLSMKQVMGVCNPDIKEFATGFPKADGRSILLTVLGVDWSCTGSEKSYTVLTVLGFDYTGKAHVLFTQRLDGIDILDQVTRVIEVSNRFECSHIASDRGVGVLQGQLMKRALGDDRVSMINYVTAKTNLRFDREGNYYAADRTLAIDTAVIRVKMGPARIESPCWDIMEPFWSDALHIFEEESHTGRRLYRKDEDGTDDFLHSLVFALIGYMIVKGEFTYQERGAIEDDLFTF